MNRLTLLTPAPSTLHPALSLDACDPAALAAAVEALPPCRDEVDWNAVAEIAAALRTLPALPENARQALARLDAILARRGFPIPPPADELPLG